MNEIFNASELMMIGLVIFSSFWIFLLIIEQIIKTNMQIING